MNSNDIGAKLLEFNGRLDNSLDESEIIATIMTSIKNKERGN